MMRSKVISIGDEILIGQIVNTNASYIGDKLFQAGIPADRMVTIGDEEQVLVDELRDSLENYDVTVITGGLGPTHDDLTKPILVKFFNDELVLDEAVMSDVEHIFKSRGIPMPEMNREQAMVPKSCTVIRNKNGTAPGMWFEKDGKIIVSMPGVPYEMKGMMDEFVIPHIKDYFKERIDYVMRYRTILTTGIGESSLFEKVGDLKDVLGDGKLAYLPSPAGVRMRVQIKAKNDEEAENILDRIEKVIQEKAGEFIYGTGEEKLEMKLGEGLKKKKYNLAVAESCTGGLISSTIVSIPGSSDYYLGGVCTYANEAKMEVLGVNPETLRLYGAVSEQTAKEMAEGVRKRFNADVSVSTTGIAGPAGGSEEKPVGLVWIGYSDKDKTYAKKFNFGDDRERNIFRATTKALEILYKEQAT
jgi:nicotinamide-nucleotide amidase